VSCKIIVKVTYLVAHGCFKGAQTALEGNVEKGLLCERVQLEVIILKLLGELIPPRRIVELTVPFTPCLLVWKREQRQCLEFLRYCNTEKKKRRKKKKATI